MHCKLYVNRNDLGRLFFKSIRKESSNLSSKICLHILDGGLSLDRKGRRRMVPLKKNLPVAFPLIIDSFTPRGNERNDSMYLRKMLLN